MRKNLSVAAALIGLCALGLTACSKEEDKSANQSAPTTAMLSEQPSPIEQNQAVPVQPMDNASAANNQPVQAQSPADATSQAAPAQHAENNQPPVPVAAEPLQQQQLRSNQLADSSSSTNSSIPSIGSSDQNPSPQATPPAIDNNAGLSSTSAESTADSTSVPSSASSTPDGASSGN